MNDSFIKRIIKKPPFIFPWVALFHVFMLVYSVWDTIPSPFPSEYWLKSLWALSFALCWLFTCDLRKWAAIGYVLLALGNFALRFTLKQPMDIAIYTFSFFEVTLLCSFFILFYFRRFGR